MFSLLKKRWFLILLGLVLLALFIWYAGPYFAFADFRPLESPTARLIAIALVVVVAGVSVLRERLRWNMASDKLGSAFGKRT